MTPLVSDTPTATTNSSHSTPPGPVPLTPELLRSKSIRLALTPGQLSDIQHIAQAWCVPPSTAAYGIIAQFLSECRSGTGDHTSKDDIIEQAARLYLSNLPPK